ncbi:hypothetical protein GCM10007874_14080 [Labrys miyagiensis]|uniref:Elp3/MiaA/NifB-like radical SAM core domain-containing protein n=1 Tax=Labrys miyagiensis TaxID=346912 RepID=A0ABQ6CDQ6_9HYPH|nr:hypothetical protein [Labrys miyagiensis]GLS18391.1 hypothetical protein GCM10007874_14080 [Labrys miyagiensis]
MFISVAENRFRPRIVVICTHLRRDRSKRRSRDPLQPITGLHIASFIDPDQYEVVLYHENWHGPFDTSRCPSCALVFLTGLHADFDRMRQLSYHFRRQGAVVVAGGNFCTLFPDFAAQFFDCVCVGGVESIRTLLQDYEAGQVQRIYRSSQAITPVHEVPYELLDGNDLNLPFHLLEASRGCSFRCKFCVIPAEQAHHAPYSLDSLQFSLDRALSSAPWTSLRRWYPIVWLMDNNASDSAEHLMQVSDLMGRDKCVRAWGALVTQNILKDRKLLATLRARKCRMLFAGLESLDIEFLRRSNKKQNLANVGSVISDMLYAESIGITLAYGFLFDPRYSTVEDIRAQLGAIARSRGTPLPAFCSALIPLPGTATFWESVDKGELRPNIRLRDMDGECIVFSNARDDDRSLTELSRMLHAAPGRLFNRRSIAVTTLHRLRNIGFGSFLNWIAALGSIARYLGYANSYQHADSRSYIAGRDRLDPQYSEYPVGISAADRIRYFDPVMVTDDNGAVEGWIRAARPEQTGQENRHFRPRVAVTNVTARMTE